MKKQATRSKRSSAKRPKAASRRKSYPATPAGKVQQYIDDVKSGKRCAGKLERCAVERHLHDLKHAKKRGLRFDETLATRACALFPLLKLTDGEWADRPFELKPFQAFIVWNLFGWVRISDGMRRFRRALLEFGRGNGKTPFLAGIAILVFIFDLPVEPRAACYAAATTREQSTRLFFEDLKAFIDRNPHLQDFVKVGPNQIRVHATGATFECLSSDGTVADGLRPHFAAIDEFHEWIGAKHKKLWDKLITALSKRRQPLLIIITTAGDDQSKLWLEVYHFAVGIVTNYTKARGDSFFAFICEIDEKDDPFDESCWPKANPMLEFGVVKIDGLRDMADEARWNPSTKKTLERYHCNRLVSSTTKSIPSDLWARGKKDPPNLESRQCRGGLDWGWKDDLTALALVFPLEAVKVKGEWRRTYACKVQCWIPEATQRDLTAEPWQSFIDAGDLIVTPGDVTDTAAIYQYVEECQSLYGIESMAMDPNNCREFGSRVQNEFGIEPIWFGQTHGKYNEPMRELKGALREKRFYHGGNELLAWSADNMMESTDGREYIMPAKKKSKDKIDPMCALIMALSECLFAEREGPSIYEEPGNLLL